jgi:putative pyruvate formate lyase activating enzyme
VRILVLPGHAREAVENLEWLAAEVSTEVELSLMSQYTPAYRALSVRPFDRKVTEEEYLLVTDAAERLGFESGWTQDFAAADPQSPLFGENMTADHGSVG